jgi:hypothetical protein
LNKQVLWIPRIDTPIGKYRCRHVTAPFFIALLSQTPLALSSPPSLFVNVWLISFYERQMSRKKIGFGGLFPFELGHVMGADLINGNGVIACTKRQSPASPSFA